MVRRYFLSWENLEPDGMIPELRLRWGISWGLVVLGTGSCWVEDDTDRFIISKGINDWSGKWTWVILDQPWSYWNYRRACSYSSFHWAVTVADRVHWEWICRKQLSTSSGPVMISWQTLLTSHYSMLMSPSTSRRSLSSQCQRKVR